MGCRGISCANVKLPDLSGDLVEGYSAESTQISKFIREQYQEEIYLNFGTVND